MYDCNIVSASEYENRCTVHNRSQLACLQARVISVDLQKGVVDGMLTEAMEILGDVVDGRGDSPGLRHQAQQLLFKWQRGEHLEQPEKRNVSSPNPPRRDLGNCHRCDKPITDACDHSFICNECLRENE